jgi:hypothetical protein
MNFSLKLAFGGLGCLAVSLLVPSVKVAMSPSPLVLHGWEAAYVAVEALTDGSAKHPTFLALGLAGAFNVLFVLIPAALMRGASRRLLNLLGFLAAVGAGLSAISQFVVDGAHPLTGYFIWLGGYVLLCSALMHALHRRRGIGSARL